MTRICNCYVSDSSGPSRSLHGKPSRHPLSLPRVVLQTRATLGLGGLQGHSAIPEHVPLLCHPMAVSSREGRAPKVLILSPKMLIHPHKPTSLPSLGTVIHLLPS